METNNTVNNNGFPSDYEETVVSQILLENGIREGHAEVIGGTKKGDNYVGEIHRVKATGKNTDGKEILLRLIYKLAPSSATRMDITAPLFEKEIYVYESVLPFLRQTESSVNIPESERLSAAKCYKTIKEHMHEAIIMEDISCNGYIMADRKKSLDWKHISLILTDLARLHGLSYIAKQNNTLSFNKLAEQCKDALFNEDKTFTKMHEVKHSFDVRYNLVVKAMLNPNHKELLKNLFNKRDDVMCNVISPGLAGNTAVVCHADAWINNILFQYDKDGNPTKLCLLDWQQTRYASPLTDILYTLWLCTDEDFRRSHYDEAFEHYYRTLGKYLANVGMDVETVYPKQQFLDDRKKYSLHGLFWATLAIPYFMAEGEETPHGDESEADLEKAVDHLMNARFVERINGIVSDFVRLGYL